MITITINDEKQQVAENCTLLQLLQQLGIDEKRRGIALCLNLQVVPCDSWNSTVLSNGDRIDLVTAAPGG